MRKSLSTSFILFVATASLVACSGSSSKGPDGEGEGFFSDEDLATAERQWGEGNIPLAQGGDALSRDGEITPSTPFQDIRFDFDSADVPPRYRLALESSAQVMLGDPSLSVEIEGHCDARGTNEYNLALGKERARTVARYLVNLGVAPERLSTITYGEEIPLDPTNSDEAFAQNRRAHFALFRDKNSR